MTMFPASRAPALGSVTLLLAAVLSLVPVSTLDAYREDVHRHALFALALVSGWSWSDAGLIASADYALDENEDTEATIEVSASRLLPHQSPRSYAFHCFEPIFATTFHLPPADLSQMIVEPWPAYPQLDGGGQPSVLPDGRFVTTTTAAAFDHGLTAGSAVAAPDAAGCDYGVNVVVVNSGPGAAPPARIVVAIINPDETGAAGGSTDIEPLGSNQLVPVAVGAKTSQPCVAGAAFVAEVQPRDTRPERWNDARASNNRWQGWVRSVLPATGR